MKGKGPITLGLAGLVVGILSASSVDASISRDLSRPALGVAADPFAATRQLALPSLTEKLKAIDERLTTASGCVVLCELASGIEAHPFGRAVSVTPIGTQDAWGNYRFTSELGVKIRFSTHMDYWKTGSTLNRGELTINFLLTWKAAGIPNADILKAMTVTGYECAQVEKERGPVKPGMFADLAMPVSASWRPPLSSKDRKPRTSSSNASALPGSRRV